MVAGILQRYEKYLTRPKNESYAAGSASISVSSIFLSLIIHPTKKSSAMIIISDSKTLVKVDTAIMPSEKRRSIWPKMDW